MIVAIWHKWLHMQKHNKQWHEQDIQDELQEYKEAKGIIARWSELSDVAYTYTRAIRYSKVEISRPLTLWQHWIGLIYMFPKYTLRWLYFKKLGKHFHTTIYCVRNPKKIHKLSAIANEYHINEQEFIEHAKKLQRYRIFLP